MTMKKLAGHNDKQTHPPTFFRPKVWAICSCDQSYLNIIMLSYEQLYTILGHVMNYKKYVIKHLNHDNVQDYAMYLKWICSYFNSIIFTVKYVLACSYATCTMEKTI